jgi:pimeloyl-ACP methyl ester carboxylesterase
MKRSAAHLNWCPRPRRALHISAGVYTASGDAPPEKRWRYVFAEGERLLDSGGLPDTLPDWLTQADIDHSTAEFTRNGFRGPLNWYRNLDRAWEQSRFLSGTPLRLPVLFAAGEKDAVVEMYRPAVDALPHTCTDLRVNTLLPGVGHWIQQERPAEVNELLTRFPGGL